MITQYLSNTNESTTIPILQKNLTKQGLKSCVSNLDGAACTAFRYFQLLSLPYISVVSPAVATCKSQLLMPDC